ncbi:hypothetical protein A2996_01430 [Candidatus Campbellbacteria bacterium RIFCSPLOWO2_01_FULL_34_15]|uniref:Uncharacterized protein n=2 Tax=Candidatus Campbelliibacteriota TaxID=1752727 RepID=A0A1F5EPL0_9BACT|nr:MAG: hypothetical protein A2811_00610 [Candidatus Campbellbacteria bacterium RIFCSPHIGHO2_01_FULL_34_10]OGD69260.1 MAG: hypothetical protein A2996_01430 [Candidatus Campbellbacteria bacterium RIFCSPLOWO2_01_FULL_34_15]
MAQMLTVIEKIGDILNPLHGITPRMMSAEDGKLGFLEEDFPGVNRGDMFVIAHPDHFANRAIGDFSSENLQHDLFPDGFGDDDDELIFANDEHIFPDEQAMEDPAYAEAWKQFVAEKGVNFTDRWMDDIPLLRVDGKSPTSQRQQEKILIPSDSERLRRSHGRRGRQHVPSIPERIRHHNKTLSVLAPAE